MIRRWYLVWVYLDGSVAMDPNVASTGEYYCEFLAKHKNDATYSDELSWWWTNWYRYSRNSLAHNIIFGYRHLISPNITPDYKMYILWVDTINLDAPDVLCHGPFDFTPITSLNQTRNRVASIDWWQLHSICQSLNILALPDGCSQTVCHHSLTEGIPCY